ncbi:hypothetical protein, partial [Streptococcus pneumoniae]|uniref:hypothetical protein n=1 Tax=Streptococcus pneumoniae TaxID=1313 RepID=UPI001C5C9A35
IGLTTTLKNAWTTSRQVNFFWVANFNLKFGKLKLFSFIYRKIKAIATIQLTTEITIPKILRIFSIL